MSHFLWCPRTVALQAPLSMGFPRWEYWSRLPFPSPEHLPSPATEHESPALACRFFTTEPSGKPQVSAYSNLKEALIFSTIFKIFWNYLSKYSWYLLSVTISFFYYIEHQSFWISLFQTLLKIFKKLTLIAYFIKTTTFSPNWIAV